jgi:hypothetical protein
MPQKNNFSPKLVERSGVNMRKLDFELFQGFLSFFFKPLPHLDVFWRFFAPSPFEASNREKMPFLDPNSVFRLRNVDKKWSFFRCRSLSKRFIKWLTVGGCAPSVSGVRRGRQPPSSPSKFWTCVRLKMASSRS